MLYCCNIGYCFAVFVQLIFNGGDDEEVGVEEKIGKLVDRILNKSNEKIRKLKPRPKACALSHPEGSDHATGTIISQSKMFFPSFTRYPVKDSPSAAGSCQSQKTAQVRWTATARPWSCSLRTPRSSSTAARCCAAWGGHEVRERARDPLAATPLSQ